MFDESSDERLLLLAREEQDERAFRTLYERYKLPLFRFAYRSIGDRQAAEDVVHDCFTALLQDPTRFDPARAMLRTYLFAAARNQVLKRFAKRAGEASLDDADAVSLAADKLSTPEPLRQVLSQETAEIVRRAIERLPQAQREAILLFEYEELTLAEVALVTGADIGTIKSRLHRARTGLRLHLAEFVGVDPVGAVVKNLEK